MVECFSARLFSAIELKSPSTHRQDKKTHATFATHEEANANDNQNNQAEQACQHYILGINAISIDWQCIWQK